MTNGVVDKWETRCIIYERTQAAIFCSFLRFIYQLLCEN